MTDSAPLDIFLAVPPGLEPILAEEAAAAGFAPATPVPGGVEVQGSWQDAWRANLALRGPSRVLVRLGGFRAMHLAQLDKRARKFPWAEFLRPDVPVRIEAVCRKSRIYHDRAAAQRVAGAISDTLGAPIVTPGAEDADEDALRLSVRIEDDYCSFSIDTSGALLHKRGFKHAVGKAPMRENMAALFLRRCGFDGGAPVLDPMCGSGGFVIEAAEMAAGLAPGRARAFAFERLAGFDRDAWEDLRARHAAAPADPWEGPLFYGSDRDAGAVRGALQNAERAGVAPICRFREKPAGSIKPPEGEPGLVIVNPPYGARIGEVRKLRPLYGTLGKTLSERFKGWRVGIITSEAQLARATGLPFKEPDAPVAHGGLKVRLWRTGPLG